MPPHTPPSAETGVPGSTPDPAEERPKRRAPRWVARRIWRAFPELDDYTDRECVAFIRAARKGWRRRFARVMLFVLGTGAAFGGGFAGIGLVMLLDGDPRNFRGRPSEAVMIVLALTSMVIGIGGATSVTMLVRDWLLQRWIRHILGTRGRCGSCGYSFVGLVIPDSCRLRCPECGVEGRVDASLTLLTRANSQPVRTVTHEQPVYWTRIRVRTWLRRVGVTAAVGAAALLVLVGVMEYRVHSHVAQARAGMPTSQDFTSLVQEMRPGARLTPQPLVQQRAMEIASTLRSSEANSQSSKRRFASDRLRFDFVVPTPQGVTNMMELESREGVTGGSYQANALKALTEADGDSAWKALRAALLDTNEVRDAAVPPEQIYAYATNYTSSAILVGSALCARARLAIARHDGTAAGESLSTAQLLARHVGEQPLRFEWLLGGTMHVRANDTLQRWLMSKPTTEELDIIEQTCMPLTLRGDPTLRIRYENLSVLAYLSWLFSDTQTVRAVLYLGSPIPGTVPYSVSSEQLRWGTWQENANLLADALEDALEQADLEVPDLPASPPGGPSSGTTEPPLLAEALFLAGPAFLNNNYWTDIPAKCIRTMVALERCRLKRGGYPERLEELVPDFIPAVPVGEKAGAPLGYKRLEPGTDPLERPYLLYAPGRDGKENGILNRGNPIPR